MKKLYTTMVFVFVAAFSFAQVAQEYVQPRPVKGTETTFLRPAKKLLNTPSKAGAGQFWYAYNVGLEIYMGQELEYGGVVMLCDSIGTVEYSNGDGRPQFYSLAQTFDFASDTWENFYFGYSDETTGDPIPVPDLSATNSYSIDSIGCTFAYSRGTAVASTVVDTLVLSIAVINELDYFTVSTGGNNAFIQPELPYNIADACIDGASFTKYQLIKQPLTIDDTTGGYFATFVFPVTGFENLSEKLAFVSFSFIPGNAHTLASVIGTDLNRFVGYTNDDPRSEFASTSYGSEELMSETNGSLCGMEYSVSDPSFFLYEYFVSNSLWNGNLMRPGIWLHATCNDCEWVGVEEMATKNITVRPNPATDNFTIDLTDNSNAQIELYNLVGQVVYSDNVQNQTVNVNVSSLNSGVYMLKVTQNGKVFTSKVIIK